jgi:hypothetical protein
MQITDRIVGLVTRSVSRQVLNGLEPLIAVAVDNAMRRHSKANARREAAALAAADALCEVLAERVAGTNMECSFNDGVIIKMTPVAIARFRKLQQVVDEYKARVNGEN